MPAVKCFPAPVRTIDRTSSDALSSSKHRPISLIKLNLRMNIGIKEMDLCAIQLGKLYEVASFPM